MKKTCYCPIGDTLYSSKIINQFFKSIFKTFLLFAGMLLFSLQMKAQFTATWALNADGSNVIAGTQAANVAAANMNPFQLTGTGTYGTNGYGIQTTRANWSTTATDDYYLDFPINPVSGFDINFTNLSFRSRTSGGSGSSAVELFYQEDGAGAWIPMPGTPAFPHLFSGSSSTINYAGTLSSTFTSGHTYVIRMRVYWPSNGSSATTNRTATIGFVIFTGNTVVSGPPPTVTTTGSSAVTRSTATASGDITPVSSSVTESGICWSTAANPTTADSYVATAPLINTGAFSVNITGLTAGTLYHYRAYATNGVGTSYGADLTFTTDPPILPTITTTAASAITAISAASGGNITDGGGNAVTQRGVTWNTTGTPVITANQFTTNGTGTGSFASSAQVLSASTTYFLRAYAINNVGIAYGNEITFTTLPASPTLIAVPDSLAFGTILQGATSAVQPYTLSGYFLTPAAGNITMAAPAGYKISLSSGTGFATSLSIPYTGGTLAATTIYVVFAPTALASYDKKITNSGGGAPVANVIVSGAIEPVGGQGKQGFSNKGKDFWVGYGATEKMTSDNAQDLRFTFNNPNSVAANVTISIPNQAGFTPIVYTVPANSVITTNANEIPEGAVAPEVDARLRSEGVFNSGIHIVSDQPIVAYAHNVTSQVYAATVLFPTPTLGREYISLNFTQRHNSSSSANRSYCFAIATEDNTQLEVVLPSNVSTETHAPGTTFTQTLNRGEVLNLFGSASGETGIDMSGVKVRSITGTTGCKPFAFFCGSGKITIDCSTNSNVSGSGDNLFQQMFPKVAWGYKYIVVPTQPASMNIGHVRILVDDAATVVKRNNVVLTGVLNNYYEYLNSEASVDVIEADKPVMVAQYMTTKSQCGNASASVGDPEMIYLSSVQQTIDTVSLVSSPLGNSSNRAHFLNVTLKTADAANFLLDGAGVTFSPVTNDPSGLYSYAQIPVAQSSHTLTCPGGFNAIAYGVAGDESYGYNAGTNLVDLFSGFNIQNQFASGASAAACRGSEFFMKVTLAFRPLSIVWDFGTNANLSPNATVTQTATDLTQPNVLVDSFVINGVQLYTYQIPVPYKFNAIGSFDVKIAATSPTPDGCNGLKEFTFPVTVNQGPTAAFTFPAATSGCFGTVQFTDASTGNGGTIDTWQWDFGVTPAATSAAQSPSYAYTAGGNFDVHLRTITSEGCYADTTKTVSFSGVPEAGFSANDTVCINTAQTFTDTSKVASGTIVQWVWNFGDGSQAVTATTNAAQTHTYAAAGTYTATLVVTTSTGCVSTVFNHVIVIEALPTVAFSALNAVCNTTASFALTGGTPVTQTGVGAGVYSGTGVSGGNFDAAIAGVGTQTITYTYTTQAGCVAAATQTIVVAQSVTLSITPVPVLCSDGDTVTLVPNVAGGVFTGIGVSGNTFNPTLSGAGTFNVGYNISSNACAIAASLPIVVNLGPCKPCVEPPKVFTPNGDGFYDKWIVINGSCAKQVKVNVYNRWGGLVYGHPQYTNQWDGTYKGKALPDGTYYYVIEVFLNNARNPYKLTGNVTIMR